MMSYKIKAPNDTANYLHYRCTTVLSPNDAYGGAYFLHHTEWYGAVQRVVVSTCTMVQVVLYRNVRMLKRYKK